MRNLKTIGLAAVMALAASAMFASAAQAQGTVTAGDTSPLAHTKASITTEQYPDPWVSGEEWNFFAPIAGATEEEKIRCDTANLTATLETGTATKVTATPDYIHCSAGGSPATVFMNGCDYVLTQPTKIVTNEYTGRVDLTCPEHNKIEVKVYLFGNATSTTDSFQVCTLKVFPKATETIGGHTTQELGGHVIYKNIFTGAKDDITAKVTVEGITVEDGCHGVTTETGVYKQTLTINAFKDGLTHNATNQLDLWISG